MARGLSKNTQGLRGTTQQSAATSEQKSKSDEPRNSAITSLAAVQLLCGGTVFLVALLLYSWTLAPTVTLTDSGELIVVARGLGIAHPPGVPLWIILAHLASLVPLGNVAQRINFSSALFAALTCAMLTLVVAEVIITTSYLAATKRRKRGTKRIEELGVAHPMVAAPSLGAGLLLAFSRTLWSYATITEVYALNALLIVLIFFLMLRWRRRIVEDRMHISTASNAGQVTRHDAFLYSAALIFGLALGVHHVTVALTLPAVAVIVFRTQGVRFFTSRRLVYAALISIGALVAVYAYLPLAASRSPVINWGHPRSLQEIWWHLTGRQYQVYFSFKPEIMGEQFAEFCRMALCEFGFPWLPLSLVLAFAGLADAFKRDRTIFWFLLTIVIADLGTPLATKLRKTKMRISAHIHFDRDCRRTRHPMVDPERRFQILAGREAIFGGGSCRSGCFHDALTANWPFNNRRRYFIAHDYVDNLLKCDRAQRAPAYARLASRFAHVLCAGDRAAPAGRKSSGHQSSTALVVFRLSKTRLSRLDRAIARKDRRVCRKSQRMGARSRGFCQESGADSKNQCSIFRDDSINGDE